MQLSFRTNPDTRPLPAGWIELFDEQRDQWYYKNVSVNPNRVSGVHPLGPDPHASANSASNAHINSGMSKAQQLYASSMANVHRAPVESRVPSNAPPPDNYIRAPATVNSQIRQQEFVSGYDDRFQNLSVRRDAYIRPPPDSEYPSLPPQPQQESVDISQTLSIRRELPSSYAMTASGPEPEEEEEAAAPPQWTAISELTVDETDSQLAYLTEEPPLPQRQSLLPSYSEPGYSDIPESNFAMLRQDDSSVIQARAQVPSYSEEIASVPTRSHMVEERSVQQPTTINTRRPTGPRTSSDGPTSGARTTQSPNASPRTVSSEPSSQSSSPVPSLYSFAQSPSLNTQRPKSVSTIASPITPLSTTSSPPPPPPRSKTPVAATRPPAGFHRPSEPNVAHSSTPPPPLPHRSRSAHPSVGGFNQRANTQYAAPPPPMPSLPPSVLTRTMSQPMFTPPVPASIPPMPQSPPVHQQGGPQPPPPNNPPIHTTQAAAVPAQQQRGIIDTLTHNTTLRNGIIGGAIGLAGAALLNTVVNGDPTQSILSGDTISNAISGVANLVGGGNDASGGGGGLFDNSTDQSNQADYSSMFNGDQDDPTLVAPTDYDYLAPPSPQSYDPSSFGSDFDPSSVSSGYDATSLQTPMTPVSQAYDTSTFDASNNSALFAYPTNSPSPPPSIFDPSSYTNNAYSPPPSPPANNSSIFNNSNGQSSSSGSSGHGILSTVEDVYKKFNKMNLHSQHSPQQQQQQAPNTQFQPHPQQQQPTHPNAVQYQQQAQSNAYHSQPQVQSNPYQQHSQSQPPPFQPQYQPPPPPPNAQQHQQQVPQSPLQTQSQGYANGHQQHTQANQVPHPVQNAYNPPVSPWNPDEIRKQRIHSQIAEVEKYQAELWRQHNSLNPPSPEYILMFNRLQKEKEDEKARLRAELARIGQTSASINIASPPQPMHQQYHQQQQPHQPVHHSAHLGHSPNHHQPHLGVYAAHQAHHAHPPHFNFSGPHPSHHMHPPPHHLQPAPTHKPQTHHGLSTSMQSKVGEYAVKGAVRLFDMFGNNGTN